MMLMLASAIGTKLPLKYANDLLSVSILPLNDFLKFVCRYENSKVRFSAAMIQALAVRQASCFHRSEFGRQLLASDQHLVSTLETC